MCIILLAIETRNLNHDVEILRLYKHKKQSIGAQGCKIASILSHFAHTKFQNVILIWPMNVVIPFLSLNSLWLPMGRSKWLASPYWLPLTSEHADRIQIYKSLGSYLHLLAFYVLTILYMRVRHASFGKKYAHEWAVYQLAGRSSIWPRGPIQR